MTTRMTEIVKQRGMAYRCVPCGFRQESVELKNISTRDMSESMKFPICVLHESIGRETIVSSPTELAHAHRKELTHSEHQSLEGIRDL